MRDPTRFEMKVYEAVKRIPRGRVATYGMVAAGIGCGSPRAVGQALKRNPFAPQVPCHRVIASDLGIGGFAGNRAGREIRRKLALLAREGVRFSNGKLADMRFLYSKFGDLSLRVHRGHREEQIAQRRLQEGHQGAELQLNGESLRLDDPQSSLSPPWRAGARSSRRRP